MLIDLIAADPDRNKALIADLAFRRRGKYSAMKDGEMLTGSRLAKLVVRFYRLAPL
jgi:hypothetical protein